MANFTRNAIKASFIKLLSEKSLNKITVKDIVEDCGINRNSFYYHFQDVPTLLKEMIIEDATRLIEEHPSIDSLDEAIAVAVQFALENKKAVYHIYNSVARDVFEKYTMEVCNHVVTKYFESVLKIEGLENMVSEENKTLIIKMIRCECFGVIIDWFDNGLQTDICAEYRQLCEIRNTVLVDIITRINNKKSR